ncbi:hypothetical protein ACR3K2_27680 [Cryptosporidium serpentis]
MELDKIVYTNNLEEKSIKQILRELIYLQWDNAQQILNHKQLNNYNKYIELSLDKSWQIILSNKIKTQLLELSKFIDKIDSHLVNYTIKGQWRDFFTAQMFACRTLSVEENMFPYIPLYILFQILFCKLNSLKYDHDILDIISVIYLLCEVCNTNIGHLPNLDPVSYNFGLEHSYKFHNKIKMLLNSDLLLKNDLRKLLPSFSSIIIKDEYINKSYKDLWNNILKDLSLFMNNLKEKFENREIPEDSYNLNESKIIGINKIMNIEKETKLIAELAFDIKDEDKIFVDKEMNDKDRSIYMNENKDINNKNNRNIMMASFMGIKDDNNLKDISLKQEDKSKIIINRKNNDDNILEYKDKSNLGEEMNLINKSNKYTHEIRIKEIEVISSNLFENLELYENNKNKIILPTLLQAISKRKYIKYNTRKIGIVWDQQFINSKINDNKLFNLSLTNVFTTQRCINLTSILPSKYSIESLKYKWVSIESIKRLFQGLPSIEFSLPEKIINKSIDDNIYKKDIYEDNIIYICDSYIYISKYICPWFQYNGRGLQFIQKNDIFDLEDKLQDFDSLTLLSNTMITEICILGTNIYYLRHFIEILKYITEQNNININNLTLNLINLSTNNIIDPTLKYLKNSLQQLLEIYENDINILFFKIKYEDLNNNIKAENNRFISSTNINVLLNLFSPCMISLTKILALNYNNPFTSNLLQDNKYFKYNKINFWRFPQGFTLVSYLFTCLWQIQISYTWMSNKDILIKNISNNNKYKYQINNILYNIFKDIYENYFSYQEYLLKNNKITNINNTKISEFYNPLITIQNRIEFLIRNSQIFDNQLLYDFNKDINDIHIFYNGLKTSNIYNYIKILQNKSIVPIKFSSKDYSNFFTILEDQKFGNYYLFSNNNSLIHIISSNLNYKIHSIYYHYYIYLNSVYQLLINNIWNSKDLFKIAFYISSELSEELNRTEIIKNFNLNNLDEKIKLWNKIYLNLYQKQLENQSINIEKIEWKNLYFKNSNTNIHWLINFVLGIIPHKVKMELFLYNNQQKYQIRLFHIFILLNIISNKLSQIWLYMNRYLLYVWCRKYTTDFNLYINFDHGFLHDHFTEDLLQWLLKIENNIQYFNFVIKSISEFVILKLNNTELSNIIHTISHPENKWDIINEILIQQNKSKNSSNKNHFLNICNMIIEIISYILEILSNIDISYKLPKRPSTFRSFRYHNILNNQLNSNIKYKKESYLQRLKDKWIQNDGDSKVVKLKKSILKLSSFLIQVNTKNDYYSCLIYNFEAC